MAGGGGEDEDDSVLDYDVYEQLVVVDPVREWRSFNSLDWSDYIPPARKQLPIVPDGWGTCSIHAYSEALTARIRFREGNMNLGVDLLAFIHCCVGMGFLDEEGSSLVQIDSLVRSFGVPLLRGAAAVHPIPMEQQQQRYALGTTIDSFYGKVLPLTGPRSDEMFEACTYRERLCRCLDAGPVVADFKPQSHYTDVRPAHKSYRHRDSAAYVKETLRSGKEIEAGHSVLLYGYHCPGGDVRRLRLLYQDNMLGAEPRHLLHPDSVEQYHVPVVDGFVIGDRPGPPPTAATSSFPSAWDTVRYLIGSAVSRY